MVASERTPLGSIAKAGQAAAFLPADDGSDAAWLDGAGQGSVLLVSGHAGRTDGHTLSSGLRTSVESGVAGARR
jgi:hypothetical protein